jgi:GNAT superfamily N-acetyltransferase
MNNIVCREAGLDDLPFLSVLFDKYRVFYGKLSDVPAAENFLKDRIIQKESIIYVCLDNDQILGFTQLYPLFSSTRMKRLWLLNDLFVDSPYRGLGISKILIDKAKDLAIHSGAAGLSLETAKSNMIGNNLYPSVGFRLEDEVNFYFWEVE